VGGAHLGKLMQRARDLNRRLSESAAFAYVTILLLRSGLSAKLRDSLHPGLHPAAHHLALFHTVVINLDWGSTSSG